MSQEKNLTTELVENWIKQLRKGIFELAILSYIEKNNENTYGYDLIKNLKESGIKTDGNTVYPILRRLEKKKLIESTWITKDNQPKKYFKITKIGNEVLNKLRNEWMNFNKKINQFIEKEV